MERLKQFMGFPLLATNLWLLWVLQNQRGDGAAMTLLTLFLVLGFCAWIFGTLSGKTTLASTFARVVIILTALIAVGLSSGRIRSEEPAQRGASAEVSDSSISWIPYSASELASLRGEGKPVLVDFTASWCLTCQFNERSAINVPAVRKLIRERGVTAMKGDWTNSDPSITSALKSFGRVGVPLVVFYPSGKNSEAIILPELLTEKIVLDTLKK